MKAQLSKIVNTLERLACLGNGERYGNSDENKLAQEILPLARRLENYSDSTSQMAEAWLDITKLLDELEPGWESFEGSGTECALAAIRRLASAAPVAQQPQADELREAEEAANAWRRLALQFDNHRMQALWHLTSMLASPQEHAHDAAMFIKAPPLDGEAVLAQRIKDLAQQQQAEPITEAVIDAYLEDYEMQGEAEDGRDACYTPSEGEKFLIKDAIMGLLAETPPKQPQAEAATQPEGRCRWCLTYNGHQDGCPEAHRQAKAVPNVSASFFTETADMLGTTEAKIKRVEWEDDGTLHIYIDHWPQQAKAVPSTARWDYIMQRARIMSASKYIVLCELLHVEVDEETFDLGEAIDAATAAAKKEAGQ